MTVTERKPVGDCGLDAHRGIRQARAYARSSAHLCDTVRHLGYAESALTHCGVLCEGDNLIIGNIQIPITASRDLRVRNYVAVRRAG